MNGAKPRGQRVQPLSRATIRVEASKARGLFRLHDPYIDVIGLYEFELHSRNITYRYVTAEELPHEEAKTIPDAGIIMIREDVYERAAAENGRARFTFCHELGHLILHQGQTLQLARGNVPDWPAYEDSEWQADTFAAEFMMPVQMVSDLCRSVEEIASTFGVSRTAAGIRRNQLREEGLIHW